VGDVGRPDLSPSHTPEALAELLYKSIQQKLLALADETVIYPAHGAGSLCGRQMSSDASSTIGRERRSNYALQVRSCEEFVHLLTDTLPARPEYFAREVELNRRGAAALDELPSPVPLPAAEVLRLQAEGAVVLDTRPAIQFAVAHVPGSIHIALSGQYATWAARSLGLDARVILSAEDLECVSESQVRLARVGIENVIGFLEDGIVGWIRGGQSLDYIPQISVEEFVELRDSRPGEITILDVREPTEVETGALEGSVRIPLGQLAHRTVELDRSKLIVVHCKGGYRSSVATSLLRNAGFRDVANLTGGFDAWKAAGFAISMRAAAGIGA
jgi:rhodanese-related sulfurtransferase